MVDNTSKRARDELVDSEVNSPEPKRNRINSSEFNQVRDESDESFVNSPELNQVQDVSDDAAVNLIRNDLLDILDDSDVVSVTDDFPEIHDLDSVIRSFEEEILVQPPEVSEMTSGSGESLPELGFLLEASDDQLGLPPSLSSPGDDDRNTTVALERLSSNDVTFGDMIGFDDEIPSYHSFGYGIGGEPENGTDNNSGEYVTWGGLFDHEPADYWEFSYKTESLPAL